MSIHVHEATCADSPMHKDPGDSGGRCQWGPGGASREDKL